jgi:hypothetical protein
MAELQITYGTPVAMTMTGIEDVDSSSSLIGGWTSNSVNNTGTGNRHVDYLLSGQFTLESATNINTTGTIAVYVYGSRDTTPNWNTIFSSGSPGSVGAASCTDTEERDNGLRFLVALTTDNTGSAVHSFPPMSIAAAFGGVVPPYWAVWVTSNTHSGTNDWCVASGTRLDYVPIKYDI